MAILETNMLIYSDRAQEVPFIVRDGDGGPADFSLLTNKALRFVIKLNRDDADGDALIHKSSDSGINMGSWAEVSGTILLTSANTAKTLLIYGTYHWEMFLVSDETGRKEIQKGILQVTESLVKDETNLPAEN